eukprot:gene23638-1472_t
MILHKGNKKTAMAFDTYSGELLENCTTSSWAKVQKDTDLLYYNPHNGLLYSFDGAQKQFNCSVGASLHPVMSDRYPSLKLSNPYPEGSHRWVAVEYIQTIQRNVLIQSSNKNFRLFSPWMLDARPVVVQQLSAIVQQVQGQVEDGPSATVLLVSLRLYKLHCETLGQQAVDDQDVMNEIRKIFPLVTFEGPVGVLKELEMEIRATAMELIGTLSTHCGTVEVQLSIVNQQMESFALGECESEYLFSQVLQTDRLVYVAESLCRDCEKKRETVQQFCQILVQRAAAESRSILSGKSKSNANTDTIVHLIMVILRLNSTIEPIKMILEHVAEKSICIIEELCQQPSVATLHTLRDTILGRAFLPTVLAIPQWEILAGDVPSCVDFLSILDHIAP